MSSLMWRSARRCSEGAPLCALSQHRRKEHVSSKRDKSIKDVPRRLMSVCVSCGGHVLPIYTLTHTCTDTYSLGRFRGGYTYSSWACNVILPLLEIINPAVFTTLEDFSWKEGRCLSGGKSFSIRFVFEKGSLICISMHPFIDFLSSGGKGHT